MKYPRFQSTLLALCLSTLSLAHAGLVVDTGVPENPLFPAPVIYNDSGGYEFLACQITLTAPIQIDSVAGWMSISTGGLLEATLFTDESSLPGQLLYLQQQNVTGNTSEHWETFSNLNWSVSAGNYWVVFQPPQGSTFFGSMPNGAPQPLAAYAIDFGTGWQPRDQLSQGLQVSAVPEPSVAAIFAAGLCIVMAAGRLRRPSKE